MGVGGWGLGVGGLGVTLGSYSSYSRILFSQKNQLTLPNFCTSLYEKLYSHFFLSTNRFSADTTLGTDVSARYQLRVFVDADEANKFHTRTCVSNRAGGRMMEFINGVHSSFFGESWIGYSEIGNIKICIVCNIFMISCEKYLSYKLTQFLLEGARRYMDTFYSRG